MEQKLSIQKLITLINLIGGYAVIIITLVAYFYKKIDLIPVLAIISPVLLMMQKASGFWTDSSAGSQAKDTAIANSTPIVQSPNVPAPDRGQTNQ